MTRQRVLIVGASLAGVSVAESLRELGDASEIVLVGDEITPPYDRPPLSKQVLVDPDTAPARCALRPPAWYADHGVDLRTGTRAVSLDPGHRRVTFADGNTHDADHIVIATGARARHLPGWAPGSDVRYLRTLDDGLALRNSLRQTPGRLVVIGAGFIGLEVASAAASTGWAVTVLEAAATPMSRALPAEVAHICVEPLVQLGVNIRYGEIAVATERVRGGRTVRLASGETLSTDLVLVGAGAVPNTEWLTDSGVVTDDGVICDADGRTSHEGVWAAGDVARWVNSVTGRADRVEHWQSAREQGRVVAQQITGQRVTWDSPPYFWSDVAGAKIQFVGAARPEWRTHVIREGHRTLCLIGDDRLRGLLTVAHPRRLAHGRRLLASNTSFEDALTWAAA
jgi:NADPH-dependent 2,4-dienoyl-CoA reductase/sulfur reductase-like enzyme